MTLATTPFGKIFGGHVRTLPLNTFVKFQVRSFNRFWAISINSHWPAAAQTDRQTDRYTSNERIISAIHFVHLAEIIKDSLLQLISLSDARNPVPVQFQFCHRLNSSQLRAAVLQGEPRWSRRLPLKLVWWLSTLTSHWTFFMTSLLQNDLTWRPHANINKLYYSECQRSEHRPYTRNNRPVLQNYNIWLVHATTFQQSTDIQIFPGIVFQRERLGTTFPNPKFWPLERRVHGTGNANAKQVR